MYIIQALIIVQVYLLTTYCATYIKVLQTGNLVHYRECNNGVSFEHGAYIITLFDYMYYEEVNIIVIVSRK